MNHTQSQQHQHQQRQTFDATSSILSDYDEYEILDEQSSYVLFNPKSTQTKSDILSLTNTSKDESKSDTEQESEVDDDEEDDDDDEIEQQGNDDDDDDDEEELNRTDVIDRDNLSNKINSWYTSNVVSSAHHLIDEKVASWELDEDEALQVQQQQKQQQQRSPITSLDESKSLLKEFYGDDLFKYLDQEDLVKFRKFHKMTDIKNYLLNKNDQTSTIMDQILYRVLLLKEHKQSDLFLHRKFNVGTTDYINYLTKGKIPQNTYVEPVTFSDTTGGGSSLIMCGGVGFGGSTSWNDI